jgi:hypothetical protein
MSAPMMLSDACAVLLAAVTSLEAPVVPFSVTVPMAVGVPATVHVITPPGASGELVGTVGAQVVVRPAGRPVTPQMAALADTAGAGALEQVNVLE